MHKDHEKIYNYILENPLCTISDIQDGVPIKSSKVRGIIRDLECERDDVKRKGLEITTTKDFDFEEKKLGAPLSGFYISNDDGLRSERLEYVYSFIKENPLCTVNDISESLGINQNSVRIAIRKMGVVFPDLKIKRNHHVNDKRYGVNLHYID